MKHGKEIALKILVAEDESIVAKDIRARLERMGYRVVGTTSSGAQAVELARKERPDLVLMDIVLRGPLDGVEAARRILEELDLPVVFISAYSDGDTIQRAREAQAYGYVLKPFEDREIQISIEMAVYKHRAEAELRRDARPQPHPVFELDLDGNITYCNPAARKMFPEDSKGCHPLLGDLDRTLSTFRKGKPISFVREQSAGAETYLENITFLPKDRKVRVDAINITEQKKLEELQRERAKSELYGFIVSALPVFASNVPPEARHLMVRTFSERFEDTVRPRFEETLKDDKTAEGEIARPAGGLDRYLGWITGFFTSLGIKTENVREGPAGTLRFCNCPWEKDAGRNPVFCLICRAMVIRSFTWASSGGTASQRSSIAGGAGCCEFELFVPHQ